MAIDYGEAAKIAGGGFGITFLVLIVLALITWLVGLVARKAAARGEKGGDTEEGEA